MGRTLHYDIEKLNGKSFTDREALYIFDNSQRLNTGEVGKLWTCENFDLDVYGYYPYWKEKSWNIEGEGKAESEEHIEKRYNELGSEGKNHIDIVKQLASEKLVYLKDDDRSKTSGSTKVGGNELNAMMVYLTLIQISKELPNTKITLRDEGEFLLCPQVYIREGRVLPDIKDLEERIRHWTFISFINSKTKLMNEINREILKDVDDDTRRVFGFEKTYAGYAAEYTKQFINKARIVMNIVRENWKWRDTSGFHNLGYVQISVGNIQKLPVKYWFRPELFCRAVKSDDFDDYKDSPGEVMAGFQGEYFGLVPEGTEEIDSYKQVAFMQKMLAAAGVDKKQLVTRGE